MTATPERTDLQNITLLRLEREFGCDVAGAAGLVGAQLDDWLISAEDSLFERLVNERRVLRVLASPIASSC